MTCSTGAADPTPPVPKVGIGCTAKGTPRAKLILDDAASVKLVNAAVAKPDAKGIVHATGAGVTATLELIGQRVPPGRCQYQSFTGYVVVVRLDGPKASDYEFVGISGWSGIAADWLTRANDDRWVRYRVGNPDKDRTLKTGALFRNKRAPKDPLFVVAAGIPLDSKPPPPLDPRGFRGCDQMRIKVTPQPALNRELEVHIARYGDDDDPAGVMSMMAYLDTSVTGTLERSSTITIDSGTSTSGGGGAYLDYGQPTVQATLFFVDARCPDGRLPSQLTIRAQLHVKDGKVTRTLNATAVLEPRPDGQLLPPGRN